MNKQKGKKKIGIYLPKIPENKSTARYQHSKAVVDNFDTYVISDEDIPKKIKANSKETFVLKDRSFYKRASKALSIAKEIDFDAFITSQYYECLFSGYLSKSTWIIDFNDDPFMFRYNNHFMHPRAMLTVFLPYLLNKAEMGIYISHPSTPHSFGKKTQHIMDGAPPPYGDPSSFHEKRFIWAGKPYLHRGMRVLLDALKEINISITIDIYGEGYEKSKRYAQKLGVGNNIKFYGRIPHDEMLNEIKKSDFGLCVLPERTDWVYSTPIKVGEYLAGATIPIMSDFPGMRWQAEDSGFYVKPKPDQLARLLERLSEFDKEKITILKERSVERALEIQWEDLMKDYVKAIKSVI